MRGMILSAVTFSFLASTGISFAQEGMVVPRSADIGTVKNQIRSYSSKPDFNFGNKDDNGSELLIIEDGAADGEIDKNDGIGQAGNIAVGEEEKNAGDGNAFSDELGIESVKNGSESQKNSGNDSGLNENTSENDDNKGYSNKEREENNATQNNVDDNSDNKNNDDGDGDDSEDSKNQNADGAGGAQEQPAPDDTAGDNRSKADRVEAAILGKRGHRPSAGKTKAIVGGQADPSRVTGAKTMLDHTAGDGSGAVDPNQAERGGIGSTQPAGQLRRGQFDNGNLVGKGLGQPDSAQ